MVKPFFTSRDSGSMVVEMRNLDGPDHYFYALSGRWVSLSAALCILAGLELLHFVSTFLFARAFIPCSEFLGVLFLILSATFLVAGWRIRAGSVIALAVAFAASAAAVALGLKQGVFFYLCASQGSLVGSGFYLLPGAGLDPRIAVSAAAVCVVLTLLLGVLLVRHLYENGFRWQITLWPLGYLTLTAGLTLLSITLFDTLRERELKSAENEALSIHSGSNTEEQPAFEFPVQLGFHVTNLGTAQLQRPDTERNATISREIQKACLELPTSILRYFAYYNAFESNDESLLDLSDSFVREGRQSGRKIMLADGGFGPGARKGIDAARLLSARIRRVPQIALRYHPDYYSVLNEPEMIFRFHGIQAELPVSLWIEHLQELIREVRQVSPQTRVGLSVAASLEREREILARALTECDLDFIGINVYRPSDIVEVSRILKTGLPAQKGTEVWITETWYGILSSVDQPWRERWDIRWSELLRGTCVDLGIHGYLPYYALPLITYDADLNGDTVLRETRSAYFHSFEEAQDR